MLKLLHTHIVRWPDRHGKVRHRFGLHGQLAQREVSSKYHQFQRQDYLVNGTFKITMLKKDYLEIVCRRKK